MSGNRFAPMNDYPIIVRGARFPVPPPRETEFSDAYSHEDACADLLHRFRVLTEAPGQMSDRTPACVAPPARERRMASYLHIDLAVFLARHAA